MNPDDSLINPFTGGDYAPGWFLRVLSSLLERRMIEYTDREANLDFTDRMLRQKRGCRR